MPETGHVYPFAFEPRLLRWAKPFGVLPTRSYVRVDDTGLEAEFGPWTVRTTWTNVAGVERTGPYKAGKVAGPAHLSLADRGITCSATTAGGACVRFHEPVRGIDPLGLIRHPAATFGVEDPAGFIRAVEARLAEQPADPVRRDALPADAPDHAEGRYSTALRGTWNWMRRRRARAEDGRAVERVDVPPPANPDASDAQDIADGSDAAFHRRYRTVVRHARVGPEEAMAAILAEPNVLADPDLAPFTKVRGVLGSMDVGDRFVIELAGPWKGAIEVVALDSRSLRFSTLSGHMEAGVVELRTELDGDGARPDLTLTIESWARSRDRVVDLLYDKLGVAKALQGEMWMIACERFEQLVGGSSEGPVQVLTERAS